MIAVITSTVAISTHRRSRSIASDCAIEPGTKPVAAAGAPGSEAARAYASARFRCVRGENESGKPR